MFAAAIASGDGSWRSNCGMLVIVAAFQGCAERLSVEIFADDDRNGFPGSGR